MVAQKFGASDPDVKAKGSKEKADKEMQRASQRVPTTGMVGGESNEKTNTQSRKKSGATMKFNKGGMVPAHVEGGFRNKAMEHKRG